MSLHKFLKKSIHLSLSYLEVLALFIWIVAIAVILGIMLRKKDQLLISQIKDNTSQVHRLEEQLSSETTQKESLPALSIVFYNKKMIDGKMYSFEDVNPKTSQKPLNEKDGKAHFVLKVNGEELSTENQPLGRKLVDAIDEHTYDYWIDLDQQKFFLIRESASRTFGKTDDAVIEEHVLVDGYDQENVKIVRTLDGIARQYKIMLFFPEADSFLLSMASGSQDCDHTQSVTLISGIDKEEHVLNYESGCGVVNEEPNRRFGGIIDSRLVIAEGEIPPEAYQDQLENIPLYTEKLYLFDPLTRKQQLIPLPQRQINGAEWLLLDRSEFITSNNTLSAREIVLGEFTSSEIGNNIQFFAYDIDSHKLRKI